MASPSTPPRPIPRVDFTTHRSVPLTPLRRFVPTRIKPAQVDFSKIAKTPRKKLAELRLVEHPAHDALPTEEHSAEDDDAIAEIEQREGRQEEHVELEAQQPELGDDDAVELALVLDDLQLSDDDPLPSPISHAASPLSNSPVFRPASPHSPIPLTPSPQRAALVASDDDDEDEIHWQPSRRPARTPRRLVLSDSESELEPRPSAGPSRLRQFIIDLTASDDEEPAPIALALDSADHDVDDDALLEMGDQDFLEKYYDDSLGSLRDFIVDDDGNDDDEGRSGVGEHKAEESESDDLDDLDDDGHILHFSPPPRKLALPDLSALTLEADSPPHSPARRNIPKSTSKRFRKEWEQDRVRIAQEVFDDLDKRVFERKLGSYGAGATIEWSKRLLTTAGTATQMKSRQPDGTSQLTAKITLSSKVCTGKEQILSTVAHEMCHLASWIISNERKNPHGKVFKSWGRKVMRARSDIEVTTKHDYVIEYKFKWRCVSERCGKIYQRHSKSIDVSKQVCGRCRGRLEPMFETRENAFQTYLKQNMSLAKSALPGATHGDVMRALSRQWTANGPEADHQAYWRSAATASTAKS
ncbi:hypothetical protein EHS25_003786 [Saitozyma podzolica]|uniref:SprT-like domain-containing protein n=1 Tax=Saitozyma podzolica TaxID=1890683 RepID=A0A427Y3I6_9TREE|nr:hypothetical protein EHS25_003786 [Saitozyma podzolica]